MPFRLARADTIVFLDLSPSRCLARVLARAWRSRGRVRADMSEGCPERFWDPSYLEFLWYVLRYRAVHRPRVLDKIAAHGAHARLIILRTPADVARFLERSG
ncbi:MAG TPA: Topology modulation protein [Polyangia bacterium]|nr:Topology modulation protein [Polyangia bacterium]